MHRGLALLPPLLFSLACGILPSADDDTGVSPDGDGDGLSDEEEASLGLDPASADTDGDGVNDGVELDAGTDPLDTDSDDDLLGDGEERSVGTDPLDPDSDADSYLDGWEVTEGTDPTDPDSGIYTGGWPYNPEKDLIDDPGFSGPISNGDFIYDHRGKDQFAESVQLYDFLGQGRDVIVQASATWSSPDQITSSWLSTEGQVDYFGYESTYGDLREAVDNGDIYWITILVQNDDGDATTVDDVKDWHADFPHDRIPVIADKDEEMFTTTVGATGFFPTGMLLNENGKVLVVGGMDEAMDLAMERL